MAHGDVYIGTGEAVEGVTTSAETIVQVRGGTTKARVVAFGVSFDGAVSTATPVRVRLLRQTTDGTGTGATEVKQDPDSHTGTVTFFHSFTAEPTAGEVLFDTYVHPQGGALHYQYPLGREPRLGAVNTSRIGLEVTPGASVNATAYLAVEE